MKTVAIVGATGAVGREVIKLIEMRGVPVERLRLLASSRSAGQKLSFRGEEIVVEEAKTADLRGTGYVIMDTPDDVARAFVPVAQEACCTVIDNSAAYRMDPNVPLVIPEINGHEIGQHKGVIANPNCTTCIGLMALAPLNKVFGLVRVTGDTYQAVSGAGEPGIEQLDREMRAAMRVPQTSIARAPAFRYRILGNVIPQIGSVNYDGYTSEEMKFQSEGRKILGLPNFIAEIFCVRVPVMRSHSMGLTAYFEREPSIAEARRVLSEARGIVLRDDVAKDVYPMPMTATEQYDCEVGRIRRLRSSPTALQLFVSGDQLWKGAALNAVQILEWLLR